jgi:hypothetical protein
MRLSVCRGSLGETAGVCHLCQESLRPDGNDSRGKGPFLMPFGMAAFGAHVGGRQVPGIVVANRPGEASHPDNPPRLST